MLSSNVLKKLKPRVLIYNVKGPYLISCLSEKQHDMNTSYHIIIISEILHEILFPGYYIVTGLKSWQCCVCVYLHRFKGLQPQAGVRDRERDLWGPSAGHRSPGHPGLPGWTACARLPRQGLHPKDSTGPQHRERWSQVPSEHTQVTRPGVLQPISTLSTAGHCFIFVRKELNSIHQDHATI